MEVWVAEIVGDGEYNKSWREEEKATREIATKIISKEILMNYSLKCPTVCVTRWWAG